MLHNALDLVVAWPNGHLCYHLNPHASTTELEFELQDAERRHCRMLVETEDDLCLDVLEVQPNYFVARLPNGGKTLLSRRAH